MKTVFVFENGETRFDIEAIKYDEEKLMLWGLTGVPFVKRQATDQEVENESKRLAIIERDFEEITKYNNAVHRGNVRLANAKNEKDFMNAYKYL